MSKEKKERLESNPVYVDLVKSFRAKRKTKGITQHQIGLLAGTGHGRVNMFERVKYTPTLYTFVTWCTEAGIDIYLKAGDKSVRLKARHAKKHALLRKEASQNLVEQILKEKTKKS